MSSFPLVGIVSGRRNLRGGFRGIDAIGFVVAMRNFGLRRYFEGMERRESIHWRSGVESASYLDRHFVIITVGIKMLTWRIDRGSARRSRIPQLPLSPKDALYTAHNPHNPSRAQSSAGTKAATGPRDNVFIVRNATTCRSPPSATSRFL
jgi:hypothetical protein